MPTDTEAIQALIAEVERRVVSTDTQLVHSARQMLITRLAKYNDPENLEWAWDDVTDKWARHAYAAFQDLLAVESDRDALCTALKELLAERAAVPTVPTDAPLLKCDCPNWWKMMEHQPHHASCNQFIHASVPDAAVAAADEICKLIDAKVGYLVDKISVDDIEAIISRYFPAAGEQMRARANKVIKRMRDDQDKLGAAYEAEVERAEQMRAALEDIAKQRLRSEIEPIDGEVQGDFEYAYDKIISIARAALTPTAGEANNVK